MSDLDDHAPDGYYPHWEEDEPQPPPKKDYKMKQPKSVDEIFDGVVNLLRGYEGKKITVREAKQAIIQWVLEDVIPSKQKRTDYLHGPEAKYGIEASEVTYLLGYNQAIDEMRAKLLDKGDK